MNIQQITLVCHDALRAYQETIGELPMREWRHAEEWQRGSLGAAVDSGKEKPNASAEDVHAGFCKYMTDRGWKPGKEIHAGEKTHPALFDWNNLPEEQRGKFKIVAALAGVL